MIKKIKESSSFGVLFVLFLIIITITNYKEYIPITIYWIVSLISGVLIISKIFLMYIDEKKRNFWYTAIMNLVVIALSRKMVIQSFLIVWSHKTTEFFFIRKKKNHPQWFSLIIVNHY